MARQPFGALIIHGFTSSLDCVKGLQPPLSLGLPARMRSCAGTVGAPPPCPARRPVARIGWLTEKLGAG